MKRRVFPILLLLLLFAAALPVSAESLEEAEYALMQAETFDQQLEILDRIASEFGGEVESGWITDMNVPIAPGLPEGLIPADMEEHGYTEGRFPAEAAGRKFIALSFDHSRYWDLFAGDWLARFPGEMRAASLEEAEYALIVDLRSTPSGYSYVPPATSYHRDYAAYVLDLKTGEAVRFWTLRTQAKTSGAWNELNGRYLSDEEIWMAIRPHILGELRYDAGDGVTLLFMPTGSGCSLKGYEGEPVSVEVPSQVDGLPVKEINAACFSQCKTLQRIVLPEGLEDILSRAFYSCSALEEVRLPSTLKAIGESAFSLCDSLNAIPLPEGLLSIGKEAFYNTNGLTDLVLPGSLKTVDESAFKSCYRLRSAVLSEGITQLNKSAFQSTTRLVCVYLPASLTSSDGLSSFGSGTVIYAPEGCYALEWARERGCEAVACESPEEMPRPEAYSEGDWDYLLFRGEAWVYAYRGETDSVTVPVTAGGCPVTTVMWYAVNAGDNDIPMDVYISDAGLRIADSGVVRSGGRKTPIIIHAPENSLAQRYAEETNGRIFAQILFEEWDPDVQ